MTTNTTLTVSERLRVYAKTANGGEITVSLTPEQAEQWASLLDLGPHVREVLASHEAAVAALIVQRQRLEAAEYRNSWILVAFMAVLSIVWGLK